MYFRTFISLTSFCLILICAAPVAANRPIGPGSASAVQDTTDRDLAWHVWGGYQYESGGFGDIEGYGSIGLLFGGTLGEKPGEGFLFTDLRAHLQEDGNAAFNAQLGLRILDEADAPRNDRLYGINIGFDGRETDRGWHHWCHVGVETLGRWDVRANGYLNCADNDFRVGALESVRFEENRLLIGQDTEIGLEGFDVELGATLASWNHGGDWPVDIYAAVKGYHFEGDFLAEDASGGAVRLEAGLGRNISIGGQVRHDDLYGTTGGVWLTLRLWNTPHRESDPRRRAQARLMEPISRQELVLTDQAISDDAVFTGANGATVPFIHVDNTAASGGDGTFERPYDELREIENGGSDPGDVIVLYEGDGTTRDYDDGVTLLDDQTLIGAGYRGGIILSGTELWWFKNLSGRPTITTSGEQQGIRIANNNQIYALDIVDTDGNAIRGDSFTDLEIVDVGIRETPESGILLNDASGSIIITDSSIENSSLSTGSVASPQDDGIEIETALTGTIDVLIARNTLTGNIGHGIEINANSTGHVEATIIDNVSTQNARAGLVVVQQSSARPTGTFSALISGNTFSDNDRTGLEIFSFSGNEMTVIAENNIIENNGVRAVPLVLSGAGPNSQERAGVFVFINTATLADVTLRNNEIRNNAGGGIIGQISTFNNASTLRLSVLDNIITGNGFSDIDDYDSGITLTSFASPDLLGRIDARIDGNELSGNQRGGITAFAVNPSGMGTPAEICLVATNNSGTDTHSLNEAGPFEAFIPFPPIEGLFALTGPGLIEFEPESGNTGGFARAGNVVDVAAGSCGF